MTPLDPTPVVLSVAGSDSGAGAGIQADLKTCAALGGYAATVITSVTAQNTLGVHAAEPVSPGLVAAQLDAVLSDLPVAAVKLGLLPTPEIVALVAESLIRWRVSKVVLDPVMVASSGDELRAGDTARDLLARLGPLTTVLTPNVPELAALTGARAVESEEDLAERGRELLACGVQHVLCKGGHLPGAESVDMLVSRSAVQRFAAPRQAVRNTHGTGCTLSSAIAMGLARGWSVERSVAQAKRYLSAVLAASDALRLGAGRGGLAHFAGGR